MPIEPHNNPRQQTADKIINVNHAENVFNQLVFSPKSPNRKQRRILVILSVVLLSLAIVTFLRISHLHSQKQYNEVFDEAVLQMRSMNTQKAIDLFHEAARIATTADEYVKARSFEGNCQFMSINLDEHSQFSYQTIYNLYSEILGNPKFMRCEYYYDIAAGMSNIFYFSNYPTTNQDWIKLVELLESRLEFFDTQQKISQSEAMQLPTIYLALADYYWRAFAFNDQSETNIQNGDKALYYYANYNNLMSVAELSKPYSDIELTISSEIEFLTRYLNIALMSGHQSEHFHKIIEFCDSFSSAFKTYNLSQRSYILYKELYGKANYLGAIFELDDMDKAAKMLITAHDCFHSIITMTADYAINGRTIIYTSNYFIMSKLCTEEDLSNIISLYKTIFESYEFENTTRKIDDEIMVCMACKSAIDTYGFHDYIFDYGLFLTEDISNFEDYISNDLFDDYSELFLFFHGSMNNTSD